MRGFVLLRDGAILYEYAYSEEVPATGQKEQKRKGIVTCTNRYRVI